MKNMNDNRFGTVEAVKKIGISSERLRYWERVGIVKPIYIQCGTRKFRRFSQEDIIKAALIKKLVDKDKYTLEGAKRKLKETYAINKSGYQWALKFGSIEKSLPPPDR